MMRLSSVLLVCVLATSVAGQVVINEFHSGSPDWIEVCNLGDTPVDISGWHILYFEDSQTPNGVSFTFPGLPGLGTVLLLPGRCAVITEDASLALPVVPSGVPVFFFGSNLTANAGEASSCLLADAAGNGIDYLAFGNPNLLLCPFEAATFLGLMNAPATPTTYSVPNPLDGGLNFADVNRRHTRVDTDTGADWSLSGIGSDTPGALNHFQRLPGQGRGGFNIGADYRASTFSGTAPLTVDFHNTSVGGEELNLIRWDFNAAQPGTVISGEHHVSHTFSVPGQYYVSLTIGDSQGVTTTGFAVVNVIAPVALAPVTMLPFRDDMESPLVPGEVHALYGGNGWTTELLDPTSSRIRTLNPLSENPAYPGDASPTSGPNVTILDSTAGISATNEVVLRVDHTVTGDFRLRYSLMDSFDETDPADGVFLSDGITEVKINDWSIVLTPTVWQRFEHLIDGAFLTANGLTSSVLRIIFRQRDNGPYAVDGLLIDEVELLHPLPAVTAQPCDPVNACLDLNGARNANLVPVGSPSDLSGPFYTTSAPGDGLAFTFMGEPNSPVILVAGDLNPGSHPAGNIGQFDIGTSPPLSGVVVVADGNAPGFLSTLFNTGSTGTRVLTFATPALPPGVFTTFQAFILNSTTVFRATNAVQLTIL